MNEENEQSRPTPVALEAVVVDAEGNELFTPVKGPRSGTRSERAQRASGVYIFSGPSWTKNPLAFLLLMPVLAISIFLGLGILLALFAGFVVIGTIFALGRALSPKR